MSKKTVAVIFGGVSSEHDISCISAHTVIENIDRDTELNEITCDITTIWKGDEGEDDFEVTDELTLRLPECNAHSLSVDFSVNKDDIIKWKKFLLAKGCCCLLKDNQYITTETE